MSEFRITGRNVRPQRSENESENVVDLPPFPPMRTPFSDYNQNPRSGLDHESTKLGKIGVSETGSNLVESLPLANRGSGLNLTPRSCRGKLQFEPNSGPNTPTRCTGRLSTGCFAGGGRNNPQSGSKGGILLKTTRGISSCAPASPGVEVPHFALEEDGSFWTDHNVQVLLRIRPISKMEKELHGNSRCLKQENAHTVTWLGSPDTRFTFDHIAGETIIQDMLFKVAGLPMVENCMSGYNSCMFAYGQTGSGKTYTMMGELYDANDELSEDRGMTSRIFEYLFARTKLEESSRKDEKLKYSCKCSFLEIYNEQITDLLEPLSTNLQLREDLKKGVYVENLRELEVETVKDVLDLLFQGTANRKVAATSMNSESSRSHSVFTCVIESRWEKDGMTHFRFARLNLVDLAGSERQKSSGADGERLREAANINKSLSTLGLVIMTLVDVAHGKHRHVPYRDSRLTFLLQDSLGGNSKTTIIANVSPSISCAHETLSTLKFAQRAKLIQNNAKVNEDASGDVVALQRQIQELKDQLSFLEHQNIRRPLSFHSSSFCYEKVNGFLKSCGISHGDSISEATPIYDGSSLGIHISNKKLEAMLVGSLRREKMAETTVVQLKAEMEQMNRLCNQREEDSQRMKATIRHRDEKIRRLELIADSLQPADEFLMEENIALRQEIQFLQAKIDRNPELTQFSLENIRLLEQLRMLQDFYEKGEKEILLAELSELRNQLLDVFDKRDGQARDMPNDRKDMDHSIASQEKESLRLKVLNAVEELEDIKKSISATFKANTRLAREVDEMFVQVKESLNSTEPATEAMEKTSQPTSICKENMSHENDQDCKVMASSLELEELLNAKEEAWSLLETLEAQQVHLVNELADLREENGRNLGTSSVTECKDTCSLLQPMTFPQQVEVCSETFEPISENDTVSSESKQNLISPVNIENMNMIFEDIEKQSHQSSLASQPSDLHDMGDVCKRLQEADQMVLNLQAQITVLQHEIDKKSDSESISRKKLMLLRTENEELQNKLSLIIQENIRLTKVLEDKEEKFTALAESEKEADSLINSLMDGCHALEDASGQVSSIIDLFPERRIGEDEQVTGAIMAAHEKEKVISDLQTRLESAQKIGYRTNTELSCLKEAIMAITNAQMLENVEKCKEAMNLRMSLHDQTCLVHILEDKIKHQQGKLVEANRRANASFVFAGWLLSMNALQQKNKEGAHMHKPMTDTLHESISKWNQNSELSEAVLYIQSMQRHTENLEKEVEELKLALSPNNIRMGEGQEPKAYAEEKEKHKLQSRSESQKYCIPEDLISFSHQDIEKSRFLEAEDFLLNSKQRMGGKDVFCHQNSELPVLEPGHAASFAAERSNEAQSLLMKFGEAQETMKEADDVLNALLDAYEAAKHETVRWKKLGEDLMVEKAALIQQVQELKDSIQLKEQEYANIEDHFQAFMSEANDSFSLFENFFIHIKKSSSEFSLIHSDVSTFIQELLVSIRMLNSSTESVSLMILENKFALSTINHCLLDFTLQNTSLNTADSGCFYLRHSEVNGLADSFGETSMPTVKDNRKIEVINDTGKGVKRGCSESRLHVLECMGGMDMAEHVQNSSNGEDTDVDIILSSKRLSLDTVEHENGMAALLKDVRLMQDIINHLFIYLDRIGPCVDLLENVSANEKLANDDVMEKLLKTNSVSAEFACYNTRNDVKEFHEVDRSSSRANDRSVECHAGLTLEEAPFLADFQSLKNQCADLLVMLCGRSEDRHTCPWWRSSTAKQGQENDGLSTKRVSAFSNSPISSELCVPLVRGLINLGDKLNHLADSINPAKPNGPNLDVTSHKVEKLFQDICNIERKMNTYHAKISDLDQQKTCLLPENLLLSKGLNHRDLVMEGLLFDLRLLQESKSDAKDRKDEAEEMSKTLRKTRNDLAIKAANIDGILARQQKIEEYLTDKETAVAYLQSELADKQEALELISRENAELRILLDDLYVKKHVFEEQLVEQQEVIESLKKEIVHISSTVEQKIVSSLKNAEDELHKVITERDSLHAELATISGQLETALSLADENEAMAIEAQQVSEASKIHAEQKEEEARVLEQSVEELEHTINMLETKVYDMSKEVELQKLIREELELEMQDLKLRVLKTQNDPGSFDCKSSAYHEEGKDNIISRYLEERRNELMEAKRYIRMLQNEKEDQAEQIAKYQAYISELVLHSEAQASQFQEKYKALEAMACDAQHRAPMAASAAKRTEKTPVRTRASGSPFKCITGLVNQMHSDREHELHVARRRMEELESLAANRQKEVCSLNARLAVAESMTHDVIRDLLGVRLDLSTYASLLDQQVVQKLAETAERQREENRSKEEEILMLRRQLDDFMEERERLIEENNQKKSEVLDSQVKLEQLKHRQQLLTAQNELLQMDKQNLKKKVEELDDAVKSFSSSHEIQQSVHHHHPKNKENRQPRACNDELDKRLKNSEKILSHVKDELAHYRLGRGGKAPAFGVELLKRT